MTGLLLFYANRPPVDSLPTTAHGSFVDKKPHKVEEPQATYAAKKPMKVAPQKGPASAEFDRIANKLLRERKELLHKLAQ